MYLFFILSAKYLFIVPLLILGIYFLLLPRSAQKGALILVVPSLILIYLIAQFAGHLYYDPRPFVVGHFMPLIPHAPDNGFPSDHALLVSAAAMIGSYLNRKLGVVLWVLALIVAVARVYIGLHHPIDVIASIAISVMATSLVYLSIKYVYHEEII